MQTLKQAAIEIIKNRLEYKAFNVSSTARSLGIGRATIYRYIPGKEIMRLRYNYFLKNLPIEKSYTEGQNSEFKRCSTCYGYNNPNCPECN